MNKSLADFNFISNKISFRFIEIEDAEFIFSIRTDPKYSQHLSKTTGSVNDQKQWIKNYKQREKQEKEFYFIITDNNDGQKIGAIRVYDLKEESFCWGSWILLESRPRTAAVECLLFLYHFGFNILGFNQSHFDVRKENHKALNIYLKIGAEIVSSDLNNHYLILEKEIFLQEKPTLEAFIRNASF
jgi:RimJ/RimL family protein N-acetyltransferase